MFFQMDYDYKETLAKASVTDCCCIPSSIIYTRLFFGIISTEKHSGPKKGVWGEIHEIRQ